MTDRANSSGVRNLRAMFENQGAASPEPRGRSPADSASEGTSRPTSKVRASFVSVESGGHAAKDLGTTKGVGVNSLNAQRRESFSISGDALGESGRAELKKIISEEKGDREHSTAVAETIPEQAVDTDESALAPPPIRASQDEMPTLGTIMKGSDFPEPGQGPASKEEKVTSADVPADNPDKPVSGAQEDVSLKPADPTSAAAVAGGDALPPPAESLSPPSGTAPTASKTSTGKPKTNGAARGTSGQTTGKKPAAISTTKASASKPAPSKSPLPKSPGAARMPRTPTTTSRPTPSASTSKSPAPAKAPSKAKEPTKTTTSAPRTKPSTATSGTTASAAAKAKAPVTEAKKPAPAKPAASTSAPKETTTTSPGGFKKPKPRSPTRPVRLPSHLTAPTASSAAKTGEEAAAQKTVRKPATATATRPAPKPAAPKASAPPARKQASRASLAPPAPIKRPDSRASTKGGSDEGFLARMMRPTTASASKTNEKDKVASPPRKTATKAPPKPKAHESVLTKGKKKVEEIATKTKDVISNGHADKANAPTGTTSSEPATAEPVEAKHEESVKPEPVETKKEEIVEPEPVEIKEEVVEPESAEVKSVEPEHVETKAEEAVEPETVQAKNEEIVEPETNATNSEEIAKPETEMINEESANTEAGATAPTPEPQPELEVASTADEAKDAVIVPTESPVDDTTSAKPTQVDAGDLIAAEQPESEKKPDVVEL